MKAFIIALLMVNLGLICPSKDQKTWSFETHREIDGGYLDVWSFQFDDGMIMYNWRVTYTTPGASNWTCPAGVRGIQVECWGGGGGGGIVNLGDASPGGSAGGGGGGYARSNFNTTAGNAYAYTVGSGGGGGWADTGYQGYPSFFIDAFTLYAGAGRAGNKYYLGAAGGNGGSANIGDVTRNGGNGGYGAAGSAQTGAPGGSSGGFSASGSNEPTTWSTITSTVAPTGGGRGGNGGAVNSTAPNGTAPGGGGGGAGNQTTTAYYGGNGANGQIVITYLTYGQVIDF